MPFPLPYDSKLDPSIPNSPIEDTKSKVESGTLTCVFVVNGRQVDKKEVSEHPGMQSFEMVYGDQSKRQRALFAWDHMDKLRQHIFIGTPV